MIAPREHFHKRFRDDLIGCAILALIGFLTYLEVAWPPLRKVYTWPDAIAWIEDAGLVAFTTWYFRDRVGKKIVAWWHLHHAPHLKAALEEQNNQIQVQLEDQTGQLAADIAVLRDNHFEHLREELMVLRNEVADLRRQLGLG